MNKDECRKLALERRAHLNSEIKCAADEHICFNVVHSWSWLRTTHIFTYISVAAEVDTRAIIQIAWAQGKHVYAPSWNNDAPLSWHEINSFENLEYKNGIFLQPPASSVSVDPNLYSDAIALVPGLVFDKCGMRLGYGGGYYDKFLTGFLGTSIGLAREEEIVESLTAQHLIEQHDMPCSMVITETALYKNHNN